MCEINVRWVSDTLRKVPRPSLPLPLIEIVVERDGGLFGEGRGPLSSHTAIAQTHTHILSTSLMLSMSCSTSSVTV